MKLTMINIRHFHPNILNGVFDQGLLHSLKKQEKAMTSLMRREPVSIWSRFQDDMNELIQSMENYMPAVVGEESSVMQRQWVPSVDIREEDKQFVILADIPGVDPKEIAVSVDNGMLSIKGERKEETKEDKDGYHRSECSHGMFYRRFRLPDSADLEKISAKSRNGVLSITVAKNGKEKNKARHIRIES